MRKTSTHIYNIVAKWALLLLLVGWTAPTRGAETYGFRYVTTSGSFDNDGLSWATAKNNLQSAIDELNDLVKAGAITRGMVYVAGEDDGDGMVFMPTRRSTDSADGSVFNTSFRIYAGISVYGGFAGTEVPTTEFPGEEELPKLRLMTNNHTYARVESDIDADNIGETVRRWNFKYKTILSGNHSTSHFLFHYVETRGMYSTSFPLSSYHVVWFANNGKIEPAADGDEATLVGHFKGLEQQAVLDGCTIEGGYASNTTVNGHDHTGYGGGVYMVRGALLRNCVVRHCAATMRGGAVYMDGGGEVERCYIHTSQATGYGMQQGYGGAVCIDYDGAVKHTYIIQCAARIGAGLAICHVPNEYPEKTAKAQDATYVTEYGGGTATPYDPHASCVVVSNCTSNAEGAGVYLDEGGTLNHCTVVNNKCVGPDVIYYGRRHARTGGIYVRNRGTLYNTVAWGNLAPVNNDVQFASFKDAASEEDASKVIAVYHCAFSKSDITDWATATKESVTSLTTENTPEKKDAAGNFPIFSRPTATAGIQYDPATMEVDIDATNDGEPYQRVYNWHPLAASKLRQKGVQVNEALQGIREEVLHAHIETDIIGRRFEAISSIGALAQSYRTKSLNPDLMPSLEKGEGGVLIPTLLMDPGRKVYGPENDKEYDENGVLVDSPEKHAGYLDDNDTGECWEHAIGNLGNAIRTIKRRQWTSGEKKDWFNIGGTKNLDENGEWDGTFSGGQNYEHAQICVKEGSLTTIGPDCYLGTQARTASIRPVSNLRIYGGFPADNTGQTIDNRSQRQHPTKVSSNVLQGNYMNNGAHVFALVNTHDVIIDGFRMYDGNANLNAEGSYTSEPITFGGGIILNNTTVDAAKRIDMTGNIVRNCVIANCSAPDGAAIYVNGTNLKGDGTRCRAELTLINTIIRNNTAGDMHRDHNWFVYKEGAEFEDADATPGDPDKNHKSESAVVTANGNAHIWLRNCDIMNNCGYAMEGVNSNYPTDGDMFQIEIYNSILFSNGQMIRSDRRGIEVPVTCKWSEQRSIIGNYIYIDWDAQKPPVPEDVKCFNYLTREKAKDRTLATTNGTATGTPLEAYVDVFGHQKYATEDGTLEGTPLTLRYPYFVNPSRNVGHSEDGDRPLYGGMINYEPLNMNPVVNGACPDMLDNTLANDRLPVINSMEMSGGMPVAAASNLYHTNCKSMAYDSDWLPRNYGGAPDAGAIENTRLPKGGTVLYVTPDGAGKRDGSSWANAIQGNAVYQLDNVAGPDLAAGDMLDTTNGTDRVISSSGDASTAEAAVLTTDSKYNGGFGRSWFTDWKTGGTSTTTITKAWITEKNVYAGGARDGEEEVLQDGSTPTETSETTITSSGSSPAGFTAGYHYDPRYPYGEISGGSRSFWRANPYHNGTDWNNASGYTDKQMANFITDCNTNGWINNSRQERYVSGLQYAVEQAAAYNALPENDAQRIDDVDSIMVWVGNGKYTDYKGFIMRDKTTVIGSFPVSKGGTPGLSERQALMSDVVNIPKSLPAQNFNAKDYETILQLSDTDPKEDNETLNLDAVKYWDDDYSVAESTNTQTYEYKNRSITHRYTLETDALVEVTSTYLSNYTFTTNTNPTLKKTEGGIKYYEFGSAPSGFDCWHLSYPDKTNFVVNVENSTNSNNKSRTLYDPSTNTSLGTSYQGNWIFLGNGSLTGLNLWQTIDDLPAGDYEISVEMAGGYRNKFSSTDPTNIFFHIVGSDGTDRIAPIMLKTIGSSLGSDDRDTNRNMAYHYVVEFTQPSDGNLKIMIEVEDGVRNTKTADATYGTDDGGDPDPIPSDYTTSYGGNNPNRREFWISNVKLYNIIRGTTYVETSTDDETTDRVVADPEPSVVTSENSFTVQNHRTTLRKRVLTMPDVCVPTYGAGSVGDPAVTDRGKFSDNLSHTHRVFGDTKGKRTSWENNSYVKEDPNYVEYSNVYWDGFTIRHGFIADEAMAHGGGAGVNMYEGAHLQNCVIINNMVYCSRVKGCGIFCDGSTSTIEGCFVLNNTATHGTNTVQEQIFAGGMFMYEGTCFNSLFAKNYSYGSAGGLGFCVGRFYNNTIAYNTCTLKEGGQYSGGAISLATASSPNLFVANTIIYGNNGIAIRDRNTGVNNVNPFLHCYVQSEVAQPNGATNRNVGNWPTKTGSDNNYGIGNVYLNGVAPSAANTPFAADLDNGTYTGGAATTNDFRLTSLHADCINKGTEDFAGTFYTALKQKRNWNDATIRNSFIYKSVDAAELPENDVAFAARVQDCQIDMGAYEFDGSRFIEPDLREEGKAIFYVSQNGGGGLATAHTPEDAACMVKLQKVLDAAGRWKYASNFYMNTDPAGEYYNMTNFTQSILEAELTEAGFTTDNMSEGLAGLKDRTVIVKLAGDYYRDSEGNYTPTFFKYTPTRTTVTDGSEENLLEYSFMVPHGVQVLGGYNEKAIPKNDGSDESWKAFSDFTRDVLSNHTRLSGEVTNVESGTSGNAFHVVTFVNDLYTPDEELYTNTEGTQLTGQLSYFTAEKDRAVLDGLYIQEGHANGTDAANRRGAGAVVTDFAHIRNCIVQYNEATGEGGGLYLQPAALVSGSIVKLNTAYTGGGIFVEEPDEVNDDTYARIISTTVVFNTAQTVAGGMHFETNVRANSSAFWKNTANDLSNVAGTFTNQGSMQIEANCPFNYCGVESRRISGVNNIELPVAEEEGVRWNHEEAHEVARWNVYPVNTAISATHSDSVYYYPISLSSVLGRAGMTYAAYETLRQTYPTLEENDMAGLRRTAQETEGEWIRMADGTIIDKEVKNNAFIEMGARVLNGTFELHVEYSHVMTRLFVTTTQLLPSDDALHLQENPATDDDAEMYRQMGSSFLNPFHRLGDALEYIIRVRSSNEPFTYRDGNNILQTTVSEYYKDVRFEIFVSSGTFYPFRDAHGQQGEARANTFVVPEEVTIVGGVDPKAANHNYCQATTGTVTVAGLTLNGNTTEEIRAARQHMDRNGNHVKEPWELHDQTILSGNAVNNIGANNTNVYHVITCFPDQARVGKLPTRTNDSGTQLPGLLPTETPTRVQLLENLKAESRTSRDRRTIFLDGLTITGGHANDIELTDEIDNFQKLTYFRGGGILVEGNWDNSFDSSTELPEVLGVAKRDITLVTTNCLFQDNTGGNGGAVYTNGTYYAFSCHFTKNTSCGPNTLEDQQFIPWTAGGAIANNYEVHAWNCLFDNNEAKRGNLPITNGTVYDADNRQGYAGAISCSETGLVRVGNCDFVRNKAVAFPAIYNFLDNNLRAYSGQVYDDFENFKAAYIEAKDISKFPTTEAEIDASFKVTGGTAGDTEPHNYAYFKKELDDYYYGKGHHFAVNSIFWGNEATSATIHASNWQDYGFYNWRESGYTLIKDDGPTGTWPDNRQPQHVANFGPLLDISTLTFCAQETGTGREGTVWYENHNHAKSAQIEDRYDNEGNLISDGLSRLYSGDFLDVLNDNFGFYPDGYPGRPFYKKTDLGDDTYKLEPCAPSTAADCWILDTDGETERHPTAEEVASAIAYNYNLVLDPGNIDANGPYFVQPSISAGEDGYMETADWLVARLNRTVDTGWGMLQQQVTQQSATSALLTTTLLDKDGNPVDETTNQYEDLWGEGFYNLHSKNIYNRFQSIGFPDLMPIGDEPYMEYTTEGTNETRNMRRISTHPKSGVQDVFIDMGIYEYQYVQLVTGGDQTDVIWVAETENQNVTCDGSTWNKATSDLQRAIETLLLSRNEHDKMIKIRGGSYHPIHMTDANQRAFYINVPSRSQGVVLPAGVITADDNYSVRSLTIRGGYSNEYTTDDDDGEDTRDSEQNPTILRMSREVGSTDHMLEHLFIIEDAEKKSTFVNYLDTDNPDFEEYVIPILFEGITFVNPYGNNHHEDGGSAILYEEQYRTIGGNDNYQKDPTQLLKAPLVYNDKGVPTGETFPKLIIKECKFVANGKDDQTSAVKINKGGGQSLIVNSLFHSNSAAPIDAVNTKVVNCTFALNGGHLKLQDVTEEYHDNTSATFASALHNSIVWRDDQNDSGATPWEILDNSGNAFALGTSDRITHNAYTLAASEPDGTTEADGMGNFQLSKVNDDVLLGPNFKEPFTDIPGDYTEEEVLDAKENVRDFHVEPSAQILNRADIATYKAHVPYTPEISTTEEKYFESEDENKNIVRTYYWFHSVQHGNPGPLTDPMLRGADEAPYKERELANKYRWMNNGIERGAYECTAQVERVLYVRDGADGDQDGTTWQHAYDIDQLQRAIDVASVYSLTTSPQERAYVFVKASDTPVRALKLRDGVSVYGGIGALFNDVVVKNADHYDDKDIDEYIVHMLSQRGGMATKNASHNTIRGLLSENNSVYRSGFLLDGFWINAGTTEQTPVNMVKDNTVVRNAVIAGNTVTGSGQPLVNAEKGLLYDILFYDNPTDGGPVVNVGSNAYMLNCTVVGEDGQTTLSGTGADTNVKNTISQTEATATRAAMFAPYLRPSDRGGNTAYTPATYLTEWQPYWYQLHEQSREINAGEETAAIKEGVTPWLPAALQPYVDFDHDRDLLGNPRRLGGNVDNGCFETWRISSDTHIHNLTNTTDDDPADDHYAYADNYGGHLYPHAGSVLYIDAGKSLVADRSGEDNPLFTEGNSISPGYVLLKPGASIYGQGNTLRLQYLAAEKVYTSQQYALTAFPFSYNVADALSTSYASGTDQLTQANEHTFTSHTYDGLLRSAWDYDYRQENSTCWTATDDIDACEGWLLNFGSPQSKTLRFTGWADTPTAYSYVEDGSDKVVRLNQYNSNAVGNNPEGGSNYPSFTKQENMGWNLKGQPWLVTTFKTDGTNPNYQMTVPHLLYGMNTTDGTYLKSPGQIYTTRSWESDATVNLGDAFFTQTAIIGDHEDLTFHLPTYVAPAPAPARPRQLVAVSKGYTPQGVMADYVEIHPSADADPAMPYRLGSDGLKWFAFEGRHPELYVVNDAETDLSLVASAPVETDIRLGLRTAQEETLTLNLPAPEAYEAYDHVWLTDHLAGKVTDLKQTPYTLSTAVTGDDTRRLTIRFGGLRPDVPQHTEQGCVISIHRNRLLISGIEPGDLIRIYTVDGIELIRTKATATDYRRTLYDGTYIVSVNGLTEKVEARE